MTAASPSGMLDRVGLGRPELRAWALWDWANSAFMTTIIAAVFPIYFASVAAADLPPAVATYRFGLGTTAALLVVAVLGPILGAIADTSPIKKRLLAVFQAAGVAATAAMFFLERGEWVEGLALFMIGNIGLYGALVFYDSLLPHIASGDELDRVSAAGYALGYLGGGLLLAVNLAWIQKPEWFGLSEAGIGARLSFLSVAVWWTLFSLPLFARVPEPHIARPAAGGPWAVTLAGVRQLRTTLGELRRYRQAFLMLLAFLVYNDGVNTIIRMATIFGTEIGIAQGDLIAALLLAQFVGVPFSFLFGALAARIGVKPAILLALAVYSACTALGYFMQTAAHFYLLAFLVGTVQGGTQALSRSLFASMIPRDKTSEFFGFFAVFEKFSGILGPLVFTLTLGMFGSSRQAIVSVLAFFVGGAFLLTRVDIEAGRAVVRAEQRE
jgi:UMF1 family MFS transporter